LRKMSWKMILGKLKLLEDTGVWSDFNDVTYHFLQVLHTTIQIEPRMVDHVELPQRATEAADCWGIQ
jgi:hypothetical protein